VLGSLREPFDLISTDLDRASPLRLSVVSLEDDQLRALAEDLRRQGETVLVLDPSREGLNDLARTLQQQGRHYDEIQIFGHGADDSFRVGRNTVSTRTLWRYGGALETIGKAIRPGGDLLLYGCNLAEGTKGKQLIERLATITGVDVAASTDLTYADGQSSDWDLEWSTGSIDSQPFHDLLTGLNWQGQLGGTASITGSELSVTGASGAIGISRNSSGITLSGTTQTSLGNSSTVINKVTVSGTSFEISGINLDSVSTDTIYPAAYDVVLNATGSYDAGSTATSGDLTVTGAIRSFGGNVKITGPGKVAIRSGTTSTNATLIDTRQWQGSAATSSAGDLSITFKSAGADLPVILWLPQVNVNLEIGNNSGTGKSLLFANNVAITGSSIIDDSLISGIQETLSSVPYGDLFDIASFLDSAQQALSPLPATIKSGVTKTVASFSNSEIQALGSISLDLSSNLALASGNEGSLWWQDSKVQLSAAITIGAATTEFGMTNSKLITTGGDIAITTSTSNELESESVLEIEPTETGDGSTNNKIALSTGVTVANTRSRISVDATSEIKASGSVTIINEASPSTAASGSSTLFEGGRGAGAVSIGYDKTDSSVQIDGLIQADGQIYTDPQTLSAYVAPWLYSQTASGNAAFTVKDRGNNAITVPISLPTGSIVRDSAGNFYNFIAATASVDLRSLAPAGDSRFVQVSSTSFAANDSLVQGDEVTVENINAGFDFKIVSLADGNSVLQNSAGAELSRTGSANSVTINKNDRVLWSDDRHYIYLGSTSLNTTLDNLNLASSNWAIIPALNAGTPYKITAILDNANTSAFGGKDYVLAIDSPMQLAKSAATGSAHRVYRVNDTQFDGSSASLVDISANELILNPATGSSIDAFAPGQSVRYYVLPDTASAADSYPIGGLAADTIYYLIPRGGNRYALAYTIKDALANRAIDLTALGVGRKHIFHYELGANVQVSGQLQALQNSDYIASTTARAQVDNVIVRGTYEVGDVVAITLQDLGTANSRPTNLSYTVTSTNLGSIRDGLISLINSTTGVGTGTGSYLTAASATTTTGQGFSLTAKTAGSPIFVTATATNGVGNPTTAQVAAVLSVSENYNPPNQLAKKLVLTSPPATMGRMSTVQLSSGLIQKANNSLYGASAFLNSSSGITSSAGANLAAATTITLNSGDILYVETLAAGVTSGSYLRYAGTSPLTKNGADLRTSLSQQSSLWLAGAGPLLEIVQPTDQSGVYRLQGPSSSTLDLVSAGVLSSSTAGLKFTIQTAAATFNPTSAVDDANSLITLSGFSASTGEILTIRPDATYSRTITKPSLVTLNPGSISNGSNVWTGVSIPSNIVKTNNVIKATYYSTNPTLTSTGRAASSDPRGGLTEGQTVYLRQPTSGSVSLFSDAAGKIAINLSTADTSVNSTHFLMVDVSLKESSQSVGGITPGQELNVISLGSNRYQFVESQAELEAALPVSLLGRQINSNTLLAKVEDERPAGVSITSTIASVNEVESSTSIGSDMEEASWTDYVASGSASDALGDAMKDKIAEGQEVVMAALFKSSDNPAKGKVEQGTSVSGAIAINLADHNSSVTLSSTGRIIAQANRPVAISSAIEADFANTASAETEQAAAAAISVAFGLNKLSNTANNIISGSIQSGSSVSVHSGVNYLNHFAENESFGDTAKLKKWLLPTSLDGALTLQEDLSDVTGLLVGAGFNTYSTVQIHGKTEGENDKPTNSEVGVGIGINVSLLTNRAINTINGSITASGLTTNAAVTIDYVRGSGQIHFDPSPETLYGVYQDGKETPESPAPSTPSANTNTPATPATPAAKSSKSSISKDILDFGNVAKNGLGASISVITPINTSRNIFSETSVISLSGALRTTASQAGQSVGVVVGSGSSQNLGFNGGILIETGAINSTENIMAAGARVSALSASFIANDQIKQIDVAGSVQYSKAIAMGLSLIVNDLQRRTRNVLDPSGNLTLSGADGLLPKQSIEVNLSRSALLVQSARIAPLRLPTRNLRLHGYLKSLALVLPPLAA